MRRPVHTDLVQMARVLLCQAPETRLDVLDQAIDETGYADRYRMRHGLRHPEFGDGSLAGWAAYRVRPPEPGLDDPEYLSCLILVLSRLHQALAVQDTQRRAL